MKSSRLQSGVREDSQDVTREIIIEFAATKVIVLPCIGS